MSYIRHVDLPEDQEGRRVDNLHAESLESSRRPESVLGVMGDAQGSGASEEMESLANSREAENKQDPWMEVITAFIRKIDIESL